VLPQLARGDSNKMWIVPSELTDALKGIGNALGGTEPRPEPDPDDETWEEHELDDAFAGTILEDPAKALAEARGQAAQASAESTEHAAPMGRQQPPIRPPADQVPPPPTTAPHPTGSPAAPPAAGDLPEPPPTPEEPTAR